MSPLPGRVTGTWEGAEFTEADFRAGADLLEGVSLVGSGPIASRLWATLDYAIGLDMTSVAGSSNVLIPEARAKISMRIVPGLGPQDGAGRSCASPGGACAVGRPGRGPAHQGTPPLPVPDRRTRLRRGPEGARGGLRQTCGEAGSGGSIPLLRTLQAAAPRGEFILWGPEDVAAARIHASDESVDPSEIERMVVAQVLLLDKLAAR